MLIELIIFQTYIQLFIRGDVIKHKSVRRLGRQVLENLVPVQLAHVRSREVTLKPEDQSDHQQLPPNHPLRHLLKINFVKIATAC